MKYRSSVVIFAVIVLMATSATVDAKSNSGASNTSRATTSRSAVSGQYVKRSYEKKNPRTTVREARTPRSHSRRRILRNRHRRCRAHLFHDALLQRRVLPEHTL